MYKVINISSGIVAASFGNRADAQVWLEVNNFTEEGESLGLYKIVKAS